MMVISAQMILAILLMDVKTLRSGVMIMMNVPMTGAIPSKVANMIRLIVMTTTLVPKTTAIQLLDVHTRRLTATIVMLVLAIAAIPPLVVLMNL